MSKARLPTAPGTASILMLILPNSVKSAPHLVEYLLGVPTHQHDAALPFACSLGRMLPSEKFGYSSCKSFPICAVENFLKPRSLNTLAKQSWFVSSLFSCMTLLLGDGFLGEHSSPPEYVGVDFEIYRNVSCKTEHNCTFPKK